MRAMHLFQLMILGTAAVGVSACSMLHKEEPPAPLTGSLTRSFDMIDPNDGKRYGTVEMDPLNGGRVLDAKGRLIGTLLLPDQDKVTAEKPSEAVQK